jgi:hypothetical protein
MIHKLTEQECRRAMADGEFETAVIQAAPAVALILTQSWCPQWTMMRSYVEGMAEESGLRIAFVEYDLEDFGEDFMRFKEEVFANREIPYVRYYRGGAFVRSSNYVDRNAFRGYLLGAGLATTRTK